MRYIALCYSKDQDKNIQFEVEASGKTSVKKTLEDRGFVVLGIETKSNHHFCKYCGNIAESSSDDLLCNECRERFGHMRYSEV